MKSIIHWLKAVRGGYATYRLLFKGCPEISRLSYVKYGGIVAVVLVATGRESWRLDQLAIEAFGESQKADIP